MVIVKRPRWRGMKSCAMRQKGRKGWKQESGYHRRSLAETLTSYKHLIGGTLKARSEANQQVESRIAILNRMIHLGKPQSESETDKQTTRQNHTRYRIHATTPCRFQNH